MLNAQDVFVDHSCSLDDIHGNNTRVSRKIDEHLRSTARMIAPSRHDRHIAQIPPIHSRQLVEWVRWCTPHYPRAHKCRVPTDPIAARTIRANRNNYIAACYAINSSLDGRSANAYDIDDRLRDEGRRDGFARAARVSGPMSRRRLHIELFGDVFADLDQLAAALVAGA